MGAGDDLATKRGQLDAKYPDDEGQDYLADWHGEEDFRINETARIMYAGLAISTASHIESCFEGFGKRCGITLPDRANWGMKKERLEERIGGKDCLSSVSGNEDAKRVRLLGNCFKHNDGKTNAEFVQAFGGTVGDEIDYEREPWDELITSVGRFLHEVFKMARHHWPER